MERITTAQPPPSCIGKLSSLENTDMQGMDFSHMYVYKPRRGIKRGEDSKETYKLPHRLIEKKRRDRINECIAQLKDLLPEHLKLTTLGHLEKAVVLELTLKHVKTLTSLIEQQQKKIIALQDGLHVGEQSVQSHDDSEEFFRSGFHMCAKEVLEYLSKQENSRELTPSNMMNHLHKVASEVLQDSPSVRTEEQILKALNLKDEPSTSSQPRSFEGSGKNCVPVIQRTYTQAGGELSGSDTDTDSGYGGEVEKNDSATNRQSYSKENELKYTMTSRVSCIKQESEDPPAKRMRTESSEEESLSGGELMGMHSSFLGLSPHQTPMCMPFYFIPPSAAAYLPMLEKCWYPASVLYPGLPASASPLTGVLNPDKHPSSLLMSPRVGSPVAAQTPMDSPALLQALKHVLPVNLGTKD
ncbi:UNVERIFIED_CONTAM: hypothetical protein FKN15_007121 [Acipenser sinensis]